MHDDSRFFDGTGQLMVVCLVASLSTLLTNVSGLPILTSVGFVIVAFAAIAAVAFVVWLVAVAIRYVYECLID